MEKPINYKNLSTDEKEKLFLQVEKMIWSIVHQINGLSKQDKEDFFQDASLFLCEKVMPKFDPSKNVKFEYFVYTCVRNYIYRKINSLNRKNKNIFIPLQELGNDGVDDLPKKALIENFIEDESCYDDIDRGEQIKKMLDDNSDKLRDNEKRVLKMIYENKDITQRQISEIMGFSFASGVSAILARFRKRIKRDKIFTDEC